MTYQNIWEATRTAALVTWSVLFSFGIAGFLNVMDIVDLEMSFRPSLLVYFFGVLHSSVFAVSYIRKSDWSYF
jgi:hypothetical protein